MNRSNGLIALALAASATTATMFVRAERVSAQTQGAGASAQVTAPQTTATTASGCLDEIKAFSTAKQKDVPAPGDPSMPAQQRNAMLQLINAQRLLMTKECAARIDPKTIDPSQLTAAVQLFGAANMLEQGQIAVDRALALKSATPADRAALLVAAVSVVQRNTPAGSARPYRVANVYPKVEALIDELDANTAATFEQKWSLHQSMEGTYRGDDIDAGIIKHGNWILAAAKTFSPADRTKYGRTVVSAHVNMAEAYAGQGMNDKALQLLKDANNWSDAISLANTVSDPLARYQLVGTPGAAIEAPVWLNAPADTKSLSMPGHVTLLEFTAHWCGPCRESYPGINRLREQFKNTGFRVVMATRLWGYYGSERNLAADAEIAHDKDYFAEHKLDVPVAIGVSRNPVVANGKVDYPNGQDPNDTAYRVGGIPQIQLIDKQGKIRLIMVGYDNTNEEKLAKMIDALLKEK